MSLLNQRALNSDAVNASFGVPAQASASIGFSAAAISTTGTYATAGIELGMSSAQQMTNAYANVNIGFTVSANGELAPYMVQAKTSGVKFIANLKPGQIIRGYAYKRISIGASCDLVLAGDGRASPSIAISATARAEIATYAYANAAMSFGAKGAVNLAQVLSAPALLSLSASATHARWIPAVSQVVVDSGDTSIAVDPSTNNRIEIELWRQ